MNRCLELASRGAGYVAPNPMVGALVVYDNRIIGEGYHEKFGGPHAEVNAINAVSDTSLLPDSSLFVNLEPCSHHGKTPPCVDLILARGIKKVFIGATDSHRLVAGKGVSTLRENGCQVKLGILEQECRKLNIFYYTYHESNRPYIILKWAQTSDGYVDRIRTGKDEPEINWITDQVSRTLVHKWRSEVQAIIAGTRTLLRDNPRLTVRDWPGRNPVRIVPDRKSILPSTLHVFNGETETIVFASKTGKTKKNLEYVQLSSPEAGLQEILSHLYERGIQSLFVEGGPCLQEEFINKGIWDEARVFTGQGSFGSGIRAPQLSCPQVDTINFSESELNVFFNPDNH